MPSCTHSKGGAPDGSTRSPHYHEGALRQPSSCETPGDSFADRFRWRILTPRHRAAEISRHWWHPRDAREHALTHSVLRPRVFERLAPARRAASHPGLEHARGSTRRSPTISQELARLRRQDRDTGVGRPRRLSPRSSYPARSQTTKTTTTRLRHSSGSAQYSTKCTAVRALGSGFPYEDALGCTRPPNGLRSPDRRAL